MPRDNGSVSLWHPYQDKPYQDKPGSRHKLALWSDFTFESVEDTISEIGGKQYYALCNDILNPEEVCPDLVKHSKTEAYLSRTGSVAALRVKSKGKSGFLIPGRTWGSPIDPSRNTLETMAKIFKTFGYEAITPSSLSEKVLRSTLPDRTWISRPDSNLRRRIIENSDGGRIDKQGLSRLFDECFENDLNKAYLTFTRTVPSPFHAPMRFYCSPIWRDMETAWLECTMTAHGKGKQPIQLRDKGEMREPHDGETFTKWLWKEEILKCEQQGYTFHGNYGGWAWTFMSEFLRPWADIMWNAYSIEEDESGRDIMKSMMVGLPGRFQKAPEKLTLIPRTEARDGDIPILKNWLNGSKTVMSQWYMRVEEDLDVAQLNPVGSHVVMQCRLQLFDDMKAEELAGNKIIRVYIDSFTTTKEPTKIIRGKLRGQYKTKIYTCVRVVKNIFRAYDEHGNLVLKAPGYEENSQERKRLEEDTWLPP